MKKITCMLLCLVMLFGIAVPVAAEGPEITSHPSSVSCFEGDYVEFAVTVVGDNFRCRWFLELDDTVYDLSQDLSSYPLADALGYDYGAYQNGNVYCFYFSGIGTGLDGAKIYAHVNENHLFVESNKATISVSPAIKVNVPQYIDTCQGEIVDLYCAASTSDGGELSYLWYSGNTEDMMSMTAVNRGSETSDTLRIDTSYVGVTFFCCMVSSSSGKSVYSPMTRVTVYERPYSEVDPPEITTTSLPNAAVGKPYYLKLDCTDGDASFSIYYNPGKENSFDSTGLVLTSHGEIEGTPAKAGTYSFTICASGEGGEDYTIFFLTVEDPAQTTAQTTTAETETTIPMTTTVPVTATTTPSTEAPVEAGSSSAPVTSAPITLEPAPSETGVTKDSDAADPVPGVPTIGAIDPEDQGKLPLGTKILITVLCVFGIAATAAVIILLVLLLKKKK